MLTILRLSLRRRLPLSAMPVFLVFCWVGTQKWPAWSIGGSDVPGGANAAQASVNLTAKEADGVADSDLVYDRLDGTSAKRKVVDLLDEALERIGRISGYTAQLRIQERIRGTLGPEQRFEMKLRHSPFAVYMKSVTPTSGREAIFAEGRFDNKLVAHQVDWTRRLTPRLVLAPTSPLVLAYSRHPITEAGLANLARSLRKAAQLDLDDDGAITVLDRVADAEGRAWLRSTHDYARTSFTRSFSRVEVFYDPTTSLPLRMSGYDWPKPGDSGEPQLGEQCAFEELNFDVPLSDLDFDPENPAYDYKPR
jgi:hypothetical protein